MATIPTVKASTQKSVRDIEDVGRGAQLMKAIAETYREGGEGRKELDKISERLQATEKSQHAKAMKRRK